MNVSRTAGPKPPMTERRNRCVIQQLIPSALPHPGGDHPSRLSIDVHQDDIITLRMPPLCIDRIPRRRSVERQSFGLSVPRSWRRRGRLRERRRSCCDESNDAHQRLHGSNIVISRSFSAYFLGLPLISAANAEEEWAFFGGSSGENRRFCGRRKAIFRGSAAATQVARPCPRCAAGESLFWPDRRGIRGLDSSLYPLSQ